ncbi:MAG: T9SS type A sorting domain-containing protein [Bacteroidia bacterium]
MKKQLPLAFLFLVCSLGVKSLNTVYTYSLGPEALNSISSYTLPGNPSCTTTISAPSISCNTTFTLSGSTGGSGNTGNFTLVSGTGTLVDNNDGTASYTPGVSEGKAVIRFSNNGEDGCAGGVVSRTATITTTAPPAPASISGPTAVCANSQNTYSVGASTGASSYNWAFPSGCSTVSGGATSIVEKFGSTSGNVSITAQNVCGTSAATTLSVTVNNVPNAPGVISGSTLLCSSSASGISYSVAAVSGATSYNWTLPSGGNITSGSSTNAITANFGMVGGNISVTAQNICGIGSASSVALTIDTMPANPGVITGNGSVCPGQTGVSYSVAPITHATSYVWTLPTGGTIASGNNTNIITVNYSAGASSGNVYASAANAACGSGASPALLVTVNQLPVAPGPIIGSSNVCLGQSNVSYSIASVSNATSYNWSLPTGASINSGLNTNIITVNFSGGASSGNISVIGLNGVCAGSSSANFSVTLNGVPSAPSSITGNNSACEGSTNNVYSVSSVNGVTYNWSVPSGGTITSSNPNNSNSITVSYANNATTGAISVSNTSACGTGTASSLTVTLNPLPSVTANASHNPVCIGTNIMLNGGGATTYSWTGGVTNGVSFSAVNQTYTVTGTDANGCMNSAAISISTPPLPSPEICMVTTDSFFVNNIVYWDRTLYASADSFIVYRYSVGSGTYLKLGAVYKDSSQFTDTKRNIGGPNGGNPNITSWRYKMAVKDSCGSISAMSPYHETINLQQNNQNLTWNAYVVESPQSNPVTGYQVLRDSLGIGDWHVFVNTLGTSTNDPNYASYSNANYRVDALGFTCNPTLRLNGGNNTMVARVRSHSNQNNNRQTTNIKTRLINSANQFSIYPNPNNGTFTVETTSLNKQTLQVYDINNRLVLTQIITGKTIIDANDLLDGVYTVCILSNDGVVNKKLVIVK